METIELDSVTGLPSKKRLNQFYSLRGTDELLNYEDDGNFDYVSCLILLMLLEGELE